MSIELPDGPEDAETLGGAISRLVSDSAEEWLRERGGGFVTAFTVCMEYVDSEGQHRWAIGEPDRQTSSQTLGLLRWHTMAVESGISAHFMATFCECDCDDEEDED